MQTSHLADSLHQMSAPKSDDPKQTESSIYARISHSKARNHQQRPLDQTMKPSATKSKSSFPPHYLHRSIPRMEYSRLFLPPGCPSISPPLSLPQKKHKPTLSRQHLITISANHLHQPTPPSHSKLPKKKMPPQTSCAPCLLTFPTRLALRSHIRHSPSHPSCPPCHRSFLTRHALATHLTESRFHNGPAPATTGSARMGRQRRRRRRSGREGLHESAEWLGDAYYEAEETQTTSRLDMFVPPLQIWAPVPYPFRRASRRILPARRLRALPRPVSAKRLVSAVVLHGPRYLVVLLLVLGFVAVLVRGYCERYGCWYGYGCYNVVRNLRGC